MEYLFTKTYSEVEYRFYLRGNKLLALNSSDEVISLYGVDGFDEPPNHSDPKSMWLVPGPGGTPSAVDWRMLILLESLIEGLEYGGAVWLQLKNLSDSAIKAVVRLIQIQKELKKLHLHINKIGCKGAIALAEALNESPKLNYLDLSKNQIGDDGAIAIANSLRSNKTLTTLMLKDNNIGDVGAIAIADALKTNKKLNILYLQGNHITDQSAQAFADCIAVNKRLKKIRINRNDMTEEGGLTISKALKSNRTLREMRIY
ncbi:MAG: hypothetical protein KDK50_00450 [Chlamydiia bacterium]|nr:hypothetical protein [Chlamydiia bacterium]